MEQEPLIVAFYGGPGAGKSVAAMRVAAELKCRGYEAEYVSEYAKDLTWEKRGMALACQPYVCAKQMWALDRLRGQVDVIITDSSPLLGLIYGRDLTHAFSEWIADDWKRRRTLNIALRRGEGYSPAGRNQDEMEARQLDLHVVDMLDAYCPQWVSLDSRRPGFVDRTCRVIERALDKKAEKE